jgi:hypothetical protein
MKKPHVHLIDNKLSFPAGNTIQHECLEVKFYLKINKNYTYFFLDIMTGLL